MREYKKFENRDADCRRRKRIADNYLNGIKHCTEYTDAKPNCEIGRDDTGIVMTPDCEKRLVYYIKESLQDLYEKDVALIKNNRMSEADIERTFVEDWHIGERAIVFRFAHYLQNRLELDGSFKRYNLDCEYNHNGLKPKFLHNVRKNTCPDVILHKRGSNDHNLMVIEFKGYWNRDQEYDVLKICGFTSDNDKYRFYVGYTILIGETLDDVEIVEYKHGKRVKVL